MLNSTLQVNNKIGRKNFAINFLITTIIFSLISFLMENVLKIKPQFFNYYTTPLFLFSFALLFSIQFISFINRGNDIGRLKYFAVLYFIPIVNSFYLIYLLFKRGESSAKNHGEADAYKLIAEEIENGNEDKGLWLMAYAQANGDEIQQKIKYTKIRLKQISNALVLEANENTDPDADMAARKSIRIVGIFVIGLTIALYLSIILYAQNKVEFLGFKTPTPFLIDKVFSNNCSQPAINNKVPLEELKKEALINPVATQELVERYLYGEHGKDRNYEEARKLLDKGVSKNDTNSNIQLGKLYECSYLVGGGHRLEFLNDKKLAAEYYEKANAYYELMNMYGEIYLKDERNNMGVAAKKAFEYGNLFSSGHYNLTLAGMYYHGIGTSKNHIKAFELLRETVDYSEQNNWALTTSAYYDLGIMYKYGIGTDKNIILGEKYLKMVASENKSEEGSYASNLKNQAIQILKNNYD